MRETTRYLVCFAVKEEAEFFNRAIRNNPEIGVAVSGMGAANAKRAIERELVDKTGNLKAVLTCGFAGGLAQGISFGDIVYSSDNEFPMNGRLRNSNALEVKFHCSEKIVSFAEQKRKLREETGADAVEMESRVVRMICAEQGIPSATVRVISDAADEDLPLDFGGFLTREHKMNFPKLVCHLIKKPQKIPDLLRFNKRIRSASEKLSDYLVALLSG